MKIINFELTPLCYHYRPRRIDRWNCGMAYYEFRKKGPRKKCPLVEKCPW